MKTTALLQALLLPASGVMAQAVIEAASFGHLGPPLAKDNKVIPAWRLEGRDGWAPDLYSNKLVLTPPYPGSRNGGAWTDGKVPQAAWNVDMEFRASGPDRNGGNLQIWYTKENQAQIGSNSIYTVGKFEGLAIVVDMQGGRAGGIRGFLNDGSTDYKNHHHIEALAFGHCDYAYRNRGVPSKLSLKQDSSGFEVKIDDTLCFRSDNVLLPSHNYFGITAASSENPDTFEILKFVTTAIPGGGSPPPAQQQQQQQQQPLGNAPPQQAAAGGGGMSEAQLADLTNRLSQLSGAAASILEQVQNAARRADDLRAEQMGRLDALQRLEDKMSGIEGRLEALRKESKDYSLHFDEIHQGLSERHNTLIKHLPESMTQVVENTKPSMLFLIILFVGLQVGVAFAYQIYKKRFAGGPKKYL